MNFIKSFAQQNPLLSVIIFSFIITFFLTLLYKKLTDQKKAQEIEKKQKELREALKQCKNDPQKTIEIQKEMVHYSIESMKLSLKPMLISFVPLVIILGLLDKMYKNLKVGKILWELNWFWTYVLFSFVFNLIFQKILKGKTKNGKNETAGKNS
ncbi:MAG: EMC3/TMCO1 family protein [Candidatus Pacearchaeota archaeon]|nr:EMC3/TMCO1 family protein [Candidatus Pacearchaeota archaeon]